MKDRGPVKLSVRVDGKDVLTTYDEAEAHAKIDEVMKGKRKLPKIELVVWRV